MLSVSLPLLLLRVINRPPDGATRWATIDARRGGLAASESSPTLSDKVSYERTAELYYS